MHGGVERGCIFEMSFQGVLRALIGLSWLAACESGKEAAFAPVKPVTVSWPRSGAHLGAGRSLCARLAQDGRELPSVAHEDDDLLIINKPSGIGFHDEESGEAGILSVLRAMQADGQLGYSGRLHGVHRLDKVTSGLLILAKSGSAAGEAVSALREKRVAKYYVAIVDKKPKKKQGTVSGDMERSRRSAWRLTNSRVNPAVTRFVQVPFTTSVSWGACHEEGVVGQDAERSQTLRMFAMRPLTGRTHQLRVTLRALGAPIIGDKVYYPGGSAKKVRAGSALDAAGTLNPKP